MLSELRQRIDVHCEHFNEELDRMRKRPNRKGRIRERSPRTEHPAGRGIRVSGVTGPLLQAACHWPHQKDDQKSFSGAQDAEKWGELTGCVWSRHTGKAHSSWSFLERIVLTCPRSTFLSWGAGRPDALKFRCCKRQASGPVTRPSTTFLAPEWAGSAFNSWDFPSVSFKNRNIKGHTSPTFPLSFWEALTPRFESADWGVKESGETDP